MTINPHHVTTITPTTHGVKTVYTVSCTCRDFGASRPTMTEAILAEMEHEDRVVRGILFEMVER